MSDILNVKQKLLEGWSRRMSQKREGIHVSDLTSCRPKVCFERLDTNAPVADEKKIKYFYAGEEKHRNLQALLGDWECEKEIVWNGGSTFAVPIVAHPDAVYRQEDGTIVVAEIKTTESTRVSKQATTKGPYPHHIKQLKAYMAILGAQYGKLLYMILGYPNVKEYFPEYLVTFQYADEKKEILQKLKVDAAELQHGIDSKNPALVGHIARDKTFITYGRNWLCNSCPYRNQCDTMRAEAGEFKEQVRQATSIKYFS